MTIPVVLDEYERELVDTENKAEEQSPLTVNVRLLRVEDHCEIMGELEPSFDEHNCMIMQRNGSCQSWGSW